MSADAPSEDRRARQHADRWSSFGSNQNILQLSSMLTPAQLQQYEIFQPFKENLLTQISPDVTVARWADDSVLFEEGTYIDVCFLILRGEVEVFLSGASDQPVASRPIFDPGSAGYDPLPDAGPAPARAAAPRRTGQHEITMLAAMDFDMPREARVVLGPGELFGEIAALSGWPQSVTARTRGQCDLIQIRMPALRQMRRKSRDLKKRLDALYRERSLVNQLRTTPLFAGVPDAFLEELKPELEFVSCDRDDVVVEQGAPVDALYLVRSGFVKLEQAFGPGDLLVSYLSKGMTLGEIEQLVEGVATWECTARSVEGSELVRIPTEVLQRVLRSHPEVEERLWTSAVERIRETGFRRRDPSRSDFLQVALDTGLVQGHSILVIDLERCVRCDDCVRGCAAAHDGRPRFVREGSKVGNLLVTKSCYHCQDPVCLVGCPTGAIRRTGVREVVAINDDVCIGCGTCAESCPYDNIVMHDLGTVWEPDMIPEALRGTPRQVASKCDQCQDTGHGPACVSSCPQGCAARVGSLAEFHSLLTSER